MTQPNPILFLGAKLCKHNFRDWPEINKQKIHKNMDWLTLPPQKLSTKLDFYVRLKCNTIILDYAMLLLLVVESQPCLMHLPKINCSRPQCSLLIQSRKDRVSQFNNNDLFSRKKLNDELCAETRCSSCWCLKCWEGRGCGWLERFRSFGIERDGGCGSSCAIK